jgi:uncharacterized protein involved in exopolysaccharide biosynthesis
MSFTTNAPAPHHHQPEITPIDIWNFLCKAKWFVVGGMIMGCLVATIYLIVTPPIYISKVTIEVFPAYKNPLLTNLISSDDLVNRLEFDSSILDITTSMKLVEGSPQQTWVNEALKTATPSKGGVFLNITIKSNTPKNAQELAQELSLAVITLVKKLNNPKLIYLEKALASQKSNLILTSSDVLKIEIQNKILDLEFAINNASELGSTIVNGPTFSPKPISPNEKSAVLLALFLGTVTGCLAYYLKGLLLKKE